MNYPLISEYIEAIKNAEDNFNELSNLRPIYNDKGELIMSSGNFAVVFKMTDGVKNYAVKCFLKEQEKREEAYNEISEYLSKQHSDYLLQVKFYANELFVDNRQCGCTDFPILVMDWVDGFCLDNYIIRNASKPDILEDLYSQFITFIKWLLPKHFAHGDLKPDNIIVDKRGRLKLIDYDGMYVPSMAGQAAHEIGSPQFQYVGRTAEDFNEYIDDYGALYLALNLRLSLLSGRQFSENLCLPISELIGLSAKYVEDSQLSRILSGFLLCNNRGYIEREILSVCLFNEKLEDRRLELKYINEARSGDTLAMIRLGDTYSRGLFTPENPSKTLDWYYLSRIMGNINAACGICRHYLHFENDYYSYSCDNPIQHKLIERSVDFALCREGENNMFKNKEYGLRYLNMASQQNFAPAFGWLALQEKEIEKKIFLLNSAAEYNFERSLKTLGDLYRNGEGTIPKDIERAHSYYKLAAEAGNDEAQYILGLFYLSGYANIDANPEIALYWLNKAANQRHNGATFKLATIYLSGKIVPHNYEYSVNLLRKLTEKERPYIPALCALGLCYEYGWGVPSNLLQSIKLFKRAMNQNGGHTPSEIEFDKIIRIHNIADDTQVDSNELPAIPMEANSGIYSDDGKRFLEYYGTFGDEYEVSEGTEVLCDNCFNDIYSESDGHYLSKLVLPASLRRIGNNVFCASIECIECKSNSFIVKDKMLLSPDEKILYRYFGNEPIIQIPNTIEYIKGGAFSELNIKELFIPQSVKYMGANPFAGMYCVSSESRYKPTIILDTKHFIRKDDCIYSKSEKSLIAFLGEQREVSIIKGVNHIGENAFFNSDLEVIYLPSSIQNIHETAFYHCHSLKYIVTPVEETERFRSILPIYVRDYLTNVYF